MKKTNCIKNVVKNLFDFLKVCYNKSVMNKQKTTAKTSGIEALFSSKTRVKLLNLFMQNPNKSFYVREITRLVGEQINSVRRELANLVAVGIINSDSDQNKLYYQVNIAYKHYSAFKMIFTDGEYESSNLIQDAGKVASDDTKTISKASGAVALYNFLQNISGVKVAISAGVFVSGSASSVDMVVAGDLKYKKMVVDGLSRYEHETKKELNYSFMSYDEFYYRISIRDKFIADILEGKHQIVVDEEKILNN